MARGNLIANKCRDYMCGHRGCTALIFTAAFLSMFAPYAHAEVIEEFFSIPSSTPKVEIKGSIAQPASPASTARPTIILVGGTYSSADGELYVQPFPEARRGKFWYRDVAMRLAARGYRVIRFDNRGLGSVLRCEKQVGRPLMLTEYAFNVDCLDLNAAGTTTGETRVEDLMAVIDMARARWRSHDVIIVTHSEGIVPAAKLIQAGKIDPLALVLIGGFASSPRDLFHWQLVDRQIEWLHDIASQHNGIITNADIDKLPDAKTRHYSAMDLLKWKNNSFGVQEVVEIKGKLEERYQHDVEELINAPPDAKQLVNLSDSALINVPAVKAVYISELLSDKVSILDRLKDYRGSITFVFGHDDVMINVGTQAKLIAHAKQPARVSVIAIEGMDHWLGSHDHSVNENGMVALIQAVEAASSTTWSSRLK